MSATLQSGIVVLAAIALAACSDLVQVKPGADAVHVSSIAGAGNCAAHGSVHVSVIHNIGPFDRSALTVEDELATLARNSAAASGGDTVAPNGPVLNGARDFNIYVCGK